MPSNGGTHRARELGFAVLNHGLRRARHPGRDCGVGLTAQMDAVSI